MPFVSLEDLDPETRALVEAQAAEVRERFGQMTLTVFGLKSDKIAAAWQRSEDAEQQKQQGIWIEGDFELVDLAELKRRGLDPDDPTHWG